MRASRLLSIQMLLQSRGRISAVELARRLEVSVRTLYRDVDELSAAGVPIYAQRGRHGGFELAAGWKTTLNGLTEAEAQAVLLGGLAEPAAELGLASEVASARDKLLSAMPESARAQALKVSDRLHLDPLDWYRAQVPAPLLQTVADAVWQGRELSIDYASWRQRARRVVQPLGLVMKAGNWYLVAQLKGRISTFKVASIVEATVLTSASARPRGFDLADYWRASVQRFERGLYSAEADLLATPEGLRLLAELNSVSAKAVSAAGRPRRKDGRARLRTPIEAIERASAQLLALSPEVEVLGPPALRRKMLERIETMARLYCRGAPA
jgi:predicted DNA-binding transcriptional regulator YafY